MNKDEAILNIKETLKRLMSFSTDEEFKKKMGDMKNMKCEDMELEDGSMISIEEGATLDVGTPVYKKDEQGNLTPCEDGTYKLKDGKTVSCKGGVIEKVEGAATNEAPVEDAKMETEVEVEAPETESEGSDMETRIKNLEAQIGHILEMLQGMTKMQEETMSKVHEFASQPAEEPIKVAKKTLSVYEKTRATKKAFSSELDELKAIMAKQNTNNYSSFSVKQ